MAAAGKIPYNPQAGAVNQAVGGDADEPSLTSCDSADIDGAHPQALGNRLNAARFNQVKCRPTIATSLPLTKGLVS